MKTSLTLAFTAMISSGVLAQQVTNPPVPAPDATTSALTAPATSPPESPAPKQKAAAPVAKPAVPAVPLVPGPATVTADNLNVRGQAKLTSERVTQLNAGDTVTVLDEIILDKPAADEPARWARIALPANVKVWVNTLFIEMTNKTVIPRRLNLRSGPGENFSVLGLIERGQQVQEIGSVQGDWMQIEAPTNAYAFVASEYLKQEPKQEAPVPAPATTTPATLPTASVETPPITTPVTEPPPVAPLTAPEPAPPVVSVEPPPPSVSDEPTPPVVPFQADEAAIERAREATRQKLAEIAAQETPPPRVVSHEGIVRGTWSIQAPTRFALVDRSTGKTINYLYTTSTNLDLRKYKGLRIIVTGEEGLDERWKNTPVLTIQQIHVVE